ncbi:MAG: saccharopine dehydrogenase C-terminal domain-containing protein [Nanoarchaeota archaeon]
MKFDFVVLGATGLQGRIVSKDLLENGYSVLLCGRNKSRAEYLLNKYKKTGFQYFDAKDTGKIASIVKSSGANVVVNCVEGDWNLGALESCIKANAHSLDLGSDIGMTKKQLQLHSVLKDKNLVHITGCGSIPGVCNVMFRYASKKFDVINKVDLGFDWDSNIKKFVVPFSIQSIIEEFVNPALIVKHGKFVKINPLDSVKYCYTRAVGKQKCFNESNHPECYTFFHYYDSMGLKDVKTYAGFPNHSFEKIMSMIELGFGGTEEIDFNGAKIVPVEFLTEMLKNLPIPVGYKETENLWVNIDGKKDGKAKSIKMECIVPTLKGWEDAGCNIDTGMPASIMAQMVKNNVITERGSFAPEAIIPHQIFFQELKKRKMNVYENGKIIN